MPADPNRARDVFLAAIDLPPDRRVAYLIDSCGSDPDLRAEVDRLLAAHAEPDRLLESAMPTTRDASATRTGDPAGRPTATIETAAQVGGTVGIAAGTVVAGRYVLGEVIGEGGMGTVCRADQTEPVKRRVAVKLIRVDRSNSKRVLSRFEAERQAIALMDHPYIAKLLDAGSTDAVVPFFVMELVNGTSLTEYCDAHRLGVPDRLRLFVPVCQAVQHAHQKGVIHRDLKPSNVLVESHDGKAIPRVIDFGLAKATRGLALTDHTLATAFGSVMGTPAYMASSRPPDALDVDTGRRLRPRAILYELLTGTTPIPRSG